MLEWAIVIVIIATAGGYLALRLWRRVRSDTGGKSKPRASRPQKVTIGRS